MSCMNRRAGAAANNVSCSTEGLEQQQRHYELQEQKGRTSSKIKNRTNRRAGAAAAMARAVVEEGQEQEECYGLH